MPETPTFCSSPRSGKIQQLEQLLSNNFEQDVLIFYIRNQGKADKYLDCRYLPLPLPGEV